MIIGVSGFKGSGKDTVANILVKYGFYKLSFASPLKDIVAILFSWNRQLLEGDTEQSRTWREIPDPEWQWLAGQGIFKEDKHITPRIALVRIGTDLYRNYVHQGIWTFSLRKHMEKIKKEYQEKGIHLKGFILPDTRFINELSICDLTIQVIRYRYTEEEIQRMPISETEHLKHKFHLRMWNEGSLSELESKMEKIAQQL